jgi:hypothetical protein
LKAWFLKKKKIESLLFHRKKIESLLFYRKKIESLLFHRKKIESLLFYRTCQIIKWKIINTKAVLDMFLKSRCRNKCNFSAMNVKPQI